MRIIICKQNYICSTVLLISLEYKLQTNSLWAKLGLHTCFVEPTQNFFLILYYSTLKYSDTFYRVIQASDFMLNGMI